VELFLTDPADWVGEGCDGVETRSSGSILCGTIR
jgi:hypothetical protein